MEITPHKYKRPWRQITFSSSKRPLKRERFGLADKDSHLSAHRSSEAPKPCHFLRLPVEIRLQIYAYTDIGGHTIEVLNLPIVRTSECTQCYRTYSNNPIDHELVYRLESDVDEEYKKRLATEPLLPLGPATYVTQMARPWRTGWITRSSSHPTNRKRCFSVHGLFGLTSVCRQIRADTQLLVYELNAYAFSDRNYNYSSAIRAFTRSLTEREIAAIHSIYWPLMNILLLPGNLRDAQLEEPDQTNCSKELKSLTGLKSVVLRHFGNGFHYVAERHVEEEKQELERMFAERGRQNYAVVRRFLRMVAVRRISALIDREDVKIECERSRSANF